jgi:hypothetical protein
VTRRTFLLLALAAAGCATTPKGPPPLAAGYYFFDCPIFYEKGLARVSHLPNGSLQVDLLEKHKGSFQLRPTGGGGVKITDDHVPLADISRSLSGEGLVSSDGTAATGRATIWTANMMGMSRDHRKGEWTLSVATPGQYEGRLKRLQKREEARREAGIAPGTSKP